MLTTLGVLEEPFGNARLHACRLMAALLNTRAPRMHQELCRLDMINLLLVRARRFSKPLFFLSIHEHLSHTSVCFCRICFSNSPGTISCMFKWSTVCRPSSIRRHRTGRWRTLRSRRVLKTHTHTQTRHTLRKETQPCFHTRIFSRM